MSKAKNLIAKARAGLIVDQPFFASLLLPMPIGETDQVETFATDGESIVYNPKWAETLTSQEITFVLAHETLHCVFDHMGRREARTHNRWNQAADYIINDILTKEKIGVMPKGGLLDSNLVLRGNGTAEGVYKLLPASSEKNQAGKPGGALDKVLDAGSKSLKVDSKTGKVSVSPGAPVDAATKAEKSADMKVKVIQATNAARMCGKLSAGMERLVSELVKPVIDWRDVLRRFVSDRAKVDYSFSKPKRRFLGEDLYLPSLTGEKMGVLAVAVDCSGSVDVKLLNKFSAEVNAIREDVHPSRIDVVYFDSKVLRAETFESDAQVELKPCGGGGTAFSPVFEYINAMPDQPIACVFLTDLECNDFGPPPAYPVLWAVLEGKRPAIDSAPFGEILKVAEID